MGNLKDTIQEIRKKSYERGLSAGRQSAKLENQQEVARAYERGVRDARNKFFALAKSQCNPTEATADPGDGLQKKSIEPILHLDDFLQSYYRLTELGRETATDIFTDYRNYCTERNIEPLSSTAFGRSLSARFYKHKRNGVMVYHGIARA